MESEPVFWNNDIHTIYLDTTYLTKKYDFCHQCESIERAKELIQEFNEKNVGSRTLIVCGTYLVGKEKFWSEIARHFSFKVWAEPNRRKALRAINDETLNVLLTENPLDAQMHAIHSGKLNYDALVKYLEDFAEHFDLIVALRPSGWEKNNKPQYRGKVNIIGIEYSEHSSYNELKRFVQYLKPENVISTVPVTSDFSITRNVPKAWYKYGSLKRQYQPSITSFFKLNSNKYFQTKAQKQANNIVPSALENSTRTMRKEPSMIISPDKTLYDIANYITKENDLREEKLEQKPIQEEPEKVPIVENTININGDTDDDWLT